MAPATYVSVLTRAHLRSLAPLPREELLALKRTVAELGAIGRNLNQIARAADQGEPADGPGQHGVQLMLRICEALRDHVKALLLANLRSWQEGQAVGRSAAVAERRMPVGTLDPKLPNPTDRIRRSEIDPFMARYSIAQ
jgi:hypothetical protein